MNKKIKEIETELKDYGRVSLAKQCKNEYIVYTFRANITGTNIIVQTKRHYSSADCDNLRKHKIEHTDIPVNEFINDKVFDLLNRGYRLERYTDF